MTEPFDRQQPGQPAAQPQPRPSLSDAELNAVSYYAIGVGSEGSIGGRDVSNRLSFAGNIVNGRMEPVGNSGFSIGTLQTDLGQHPEVARTLVGAYQDWARANHPEWVLDARQQTQTIDDLSRNGNTIRAQGGREMDATVKSHLGQFLQSEDGIRYIHGNDVIQADKLMRDVYTPLRETALYQNATPDDQVRLAAIVGKAYNQSEVWGGRILDRIESGQYRSVADVSNGVGALLRGDEDYMQTGRDAAVRGANVVNALRNSDPQSPLRATWDNVLTNPLADPTQLGRDPARPNQRFEYDTVKDLFLQKEAAPAFIRALDDGANSQHMRVFRDRQGRTIGDDGLDAAGNNFVVWNRDGNGIANINGAWREFDRENLVRTQNRDGTVDLSLNENGRQTPLLHVDPRARALRAELAPDRLDQAGPDQATQFAALQGGLPAERAQPVLATAAPAPVLENGAGPMLQAPQKHKEMEMTPAERELFARAMNLVQNKAGMTEEDAKKVATDVIITTRTTPGLSEKPEYMDVRNGHVMIAERVGKEPIFNGYVNVEQSRGQTAEQVEDKVAVQNQQREQQTRQQIEHDNVNNTERKGFIAKVDDDTSGRVMSSVPALRI
jgi:hypothetical protein